MRTTLARLGLIGCALAASIALVGCGGGDDSAGSASPDGPSGTREIDISAYEITVSSGEEGQCLVDEYIVIPPDSSTDLGCFTTERLARGAAEADAAVVAGVMLPQQLVDPENLLFEVQEIAEELVVYSTPITEVSAAELQGGDEMLSETGVRFVVEGDDDALPQTPEHYPVVSFAPVPLVDGDGAILEDAQGMEVYGYSLSVYPPAGTDEGDLSYDTSPNGGTMSIQVLPHVRHLATQLDEDFEGCAAGQWAITTDDPELALVECLSNGTRAKARARQLTLASDQTDLLACESATRFCEGTVTRGTPNNPQIQALWEPNP